MEAKSVYIQRVHKQKIVHLFTIFSYFYKKEHTPENNIL